MENEWLRLFAQGGVFSLGAVTVAGLLGYFFRGYLKEKGKNLARREDIDALRNEVHVLTKEAEVIKASISHEMWGKQRHWEKKHDLYSRITVLFSQMITTKMNLIECTNSQAKHPDIAELTKRMIEVSEEMVTQISEMVQLRNVSQFTLCDEAVEHIDLLEPIDKDVQVLTQLASEFSNIARRDLGFVTPPDK